MCNPDIEYSLSMEIDVLTAEDTGHVISCPCNECDSKRVVLKMGTHSLESIRKRLGCSLQDLTGSLAEAYALDFLEYIEPGWINPMQANARWLTVGRIGNVVRAERNAEAFKPKPKR